MVKVAFAFEAPGAKQVCVCGEFNQWSPDATPMELREGGRWEACLALRPGRYQYKFVVDGEWIHDPKAQESVLNEHGSYNSVAEVRA
jgi:1,4-alpha-glucan branching enzyme